MNKTSVENIAFDFEFLTARAVTKGLYSKGTIIIGDDYYCTTPASQNTLEAKLRCKAAKKVVK